MAIQTKVSSSLWTVLLIMAIQSSFSSIMSKTNKRKVQLQQHQHLSFIFNHPPLSLRRSTTPPAKLFRKSAGPSPCALKMILTDASLSTTTMQLANNILLCNNNLQNNNNNDTTMIVTLGITSILLYYYSHRQQHKQQTTTDETKDETTERIRMGNTTTAISNTNEVLLRNKGETQVETSDESMDSLESFLLNTNNASSANASFVFQENQAWNDLLAIHTINNTKQQQQQSELKEEENNTKGQETLRHRVVPEAEEMKQTETDMEILKSKTEDSIQHIIKDGSSSSTPEINKEEPILISDIDVVENKEPQTLDSSIPETNEKEPIGRNETVDSVKDTELVRDVRLKNPDYQHNAKSSITTTKTEELVVGDHPLQILQEHQIQVSERLEMDAYTEELERQEKRKLLLLKEHDNSELMTNAILLQEQLKQDMINVKNHIAFKEKQEQQQHLTVEEEVVLEELVVEKLVVEVAEEEEEEEEKVAIPKWLMKVNTKKHESKQKVQEKLEVDHTIQNAWITNEALETKDDKQPQPQQPESSHQAFIQTTTALHNNNTRGRLPFIRSLFTKRAFLIPAIAIAIIRSILKAIWIVSSNQSKTIYYQSPLQF